MTPFKTLLRKYPHLILKSKVFYFRRNKIVMKLIVIVWQTMYNIVVSICLANW